MNLRNIVLLAGLAAFLAGCVINPRPAPLLGYDSQYDHRYGNDYYYDYRSTPSYEGYYYARIIFIRNVPYYVDDDRYIRPIPPRLYDHFRRYPYNTLDYPPVFSRDTEMRDGYPMSRIIYLDGVPYVVENDRIAQPLPEPLRQRFRYTPANQGNAPANGNRPQPSGQHDNGRNNEPPAYGRDRDSDQDRKQDEPVRNGRDRERLGQPPFERGQREGKEEGGAPADSEGRTTPFAGMRRLPSHQDQPDVSESHADTPNGKGQDRIGNRPQAIDDTGKKKTDKKKSRHDKKDKQGDSTKADDDSGNKKGNRMKLRRGKDGDQEDNDRGNSNRHD